MRSVLTKGMIPITKNIIVTDERGMNYGATYPKRAKGLVKNGRARFINENTICLACPPNILEDNEMKSSDIDSMAKTISEEAAQVLKENPEADISKIVGDRITEILSAAGIQNAEKTEAQPKNEFSMEFVLSRIDKIINDTDYIHETLNTLENLQIADGVGDIANQSKADAIGNVVSSREETNRQIIRLLEKMYDDLKPKAPSQDVLKLQQLTDTLYRFPQDVATDIIRKSAQQMFVQPGAEIVH